MCISAAGDGAPPICISRPAWRAAAGADAAHAHQPTTGAGAPPNMHQPAGSTRSTPTIP